MTKFSKGKIGSPTYKNTAELIFHAAKNVPRWRDWELIGGTHYQAFSSLRSKKQDCTFFYKWRL